MLIAPGYCEEFCSESNKILIAFAKDNFEVSFYDKKYILSSDSLFVGNNISLLNRSLAPVMLNILILECSNNFRMISPRIFLENDEGISTFMNFLKKVVNQPFYENYKIHQLSLRISNFLNHRLSLEQNVMKLESKIDSRLIIINRMIRTQYSDPLTLEDMATRINCNAVYLSNTYKKVFGCSPIKHLQKVRMRKGQELLVETTLTINEISRHVGYISNSQFSNYYKKYYGVSPRDFRRELYIKKEEK